MSKLTKGEFVTDRVGSLHERLTQRFENLLCRLGIHHYDEWRLSPMWGRQCRSCWHCYKYDFPAHDGQQGQGDAK